MIPWIVMAPTMRAMTAFGGMPSVRSGMNDVWAPALLADSGPATPSMAPRPNRRGSQPQDEIPLPVARHRPIGHLRRALADQDLGGDAGLAPSAAARPRHPQRPPGPQAGGQLDRKSVV